MTLPQSIFQGIDSTRARFMRPTANEAHKALIEQQQPIFDRLKLMGIEAAIAMLDALSEEPIFDLFTTIYTAVGGHFARLTFEVFDPSKAIIVGIQTKAFNTPNWLLDVANYVGQIATRKIGGITNNTRKIMRFNLMKSLKEGEDISQAAGRLRGAMNISNISRSITIARTEVIASSNFGSMQGALQTGVSLEKEWITAIDGEERETHNEANGQKVAMNQLFTVGGQSLDFPGDTTNDAGAEEVVNCRCTLGFKRKQT